MPLLDTFFARISFDDVAMALIACLVLREALIATLPEVVACWTLTGEADYLLRVWCADLPALNHLIHHRLLPNPSVARVQSQIVMDQPKPDAGLPV